MTNEQKIKIKELRHNGVSYTAIAEMLGIPKETIKSFCRRRGMSSPATKAVKGDVCRNCGTLIVQNPKTRKKVFCSAGCRTAWWKAHPLPLNNASYEHTCQYCGKSFSAYGNTSQKYCSHACYIAARFGGVVDA